MGRAVRYVFAVLGVVALAVLAACYPSSAAVAPSGTAVPIATVQPAQGQVVGVAHPVTVTFTKPVIDRASAERSITITSSRNNGQFSWLTSNIVQWMPDGFWPAHDRITVKAGPITTEFQSGAAVVGVADISAHTFTVSIDDQLVREMPASMGKPKFPSPMGSFSVLRKERTVIMDSRTIGIPLDDPEGYRLKVDYAVRITSGGVYVHSAPWSTGSQGYANVSHGCINLSPDNAAWYFNTVGVGDPVIVQA